MVNASNATLVVEREGNRYIYKPASGERPLWDFPDGTLHLRERAASVVDELLGWNLVPVTTIEDGPRGIGSLQEWVNAETSSVDIFDPNEVPAGWKVIVSGFDEEGNRVTLAHADSEELFRIAVFDAVINNADRKAGHILTNEVGKHWAIDHGVTFNAEPKLRTVLWGWIDEEIPEELLTDLARLKTSIPGSEVENLLFPDEIAALNIRIDSLLESKSLPAPSPNWPAVPWPVF